MRLLFHLGRTPELSIAEIARLFHLHGPAVRACCHSGAALTVDVENASECLQWCWELGGTIRVAEEVCRVDSPEPDRVVKAWLEADELEDLDPGRCIIGWSILTDPTPDAPSTQLPNSRTAVRLIRALCEGSKRGIQRQGRSVRFLLPKEDSDAQWLTSAQAGEAGLVRKGRDLLLARDDAGLAVYRTVWLQDYEGQSHRDYDRPFRDTASGLLPPQLARILVNLARSAEEPRILDPFCGTGGILAEAYLLGQAVVGVDKDFETVRHARDNLKWLVGQQRGRRSKVPGAAHVGEHFQWIQSDARTLRNVLPPVHMPAIATEPYLGPPQHGKLSEKVSDELIAELTDLYVESLAELRTLAKPGSRVVFLIPAFQVRGRENRAVPSLAREVDLMGYRRLNPYEGLRLDSPKHLEYARAGQTVGRRVLLLEA